jgi:hypothetical protein
MDIIDRYLLLRNPRQSDETHRLLLLLLLVLSKRVVAL